jgi:hypothetical protein
MIGIIIASLVLYLIVLCFGISILQNLVSISLLFPHSVCCWLNLISKIRIQHVLANCLSHHILRTRVLFVPKYHLFCALFSLLMHEFLSSSLIMSRIPFFVPSMMIYFIIYIQILWMLLVGKLPVEFISSILLWQI